MASQQTCFIHRSGESKTNSFIRRGRFYCNKNRWFFKTREGLDYGPYATKTECRYAYEEFIDVVSIQGDLAGISIDHQTVESNWQLPKIDFF